MPGEVSEGGTCARCGAPPPLIAIGDAPWACMEHFELLELPAMAPGAGPVGTCVLCDELAVTWTADEESALHYRCRKRWAEVNAPGFANVKGAYARRRHRGS